MKNSKLVSLVLIFSIILMGVGYAYWNDSLSLTSEVSTGNFEVRLGICQSSYGDYDNYPINSDPHYDTDYVNGTDDSNGTHSYNGDYIPVDHSSDDILLIANKEIIFQLSNVYPGSGGWFNFFISNEGTIPAKLKNINKSVNLGSHLENSFIYKIGNIRLIRNNGTESSSNTITLSPDPKVYYTLDSFVAGLEDILDDYVLLPGDIVQVNNSSQATSISKMFDIYLDTNTTDYINNYETENQNFEFELDFVFTQWNDNGQ